MFTPARFIVLLTLATSGPLAAQQLAAPAPAPAPPGPLATVQRLFDAMRQRDTAAMRASFDSNARLVTTGVREGQPILRVVPIALWLERVGGATQTLDERIWDPVVQVDDNLATVWVKYEFRVGDQFSHCGVDTFQLFKTLAGWSIFQVADSQRRDDCWHKP